ncbi:Protein of unknown function, partial [Gryllus bimaculatus]
MTYCLLTQFHSEEDHLPLGPVIFVPERAPGMLCGELGSRASPLSLHLACVTADTRSPYPALLALCRGAAMALTAAGPPPDDEDIFL